jgi:hypothetical protein
MRRALRNTELTVAPQAPAVNLTALALADLRSARLANNAALPHEAGERADSELKGYPVLAPELKRHIDARRVSGRRAHEDKQMLRELGLLEPVK